VEAANPEDAHRPLEKSPNLAASLSHVEMRQVRNDYTLRLDGEVYQIERQAIVSRLRGANVRVEKRLDDSLAVRLGERYLAVRKYAMPDPRKAPPAMKTTKAKAHRGGRGSDWNKNFNMKTGPKVWQAAPASGCRPEEAIQ